MDNTTSTSIAQQVYDSLRADTADFGKLLAERDTLQQKVKAGRYSEKSKLYCEQYWERAAKRVAEAVASGKQEREAHETDSLPKEDRAK